MEIVDDHDVVFLQARPEHQIDGLIEGERVAIHRCLDEIAWSDERPAQFGV
jgi:hypothetical protein